jgi:hypothetical protein
MIGLLAFRQALLLESLAGMARFKHEVTNRKVHVYNATKEYVQEDWKPLKCIYPSKCAVCKDWIQKDAAILWHIRSKLVMHANCPALEK